MAELEMVLPEILTGGNAATMQLPDVELYEYWSLYNKRILTLENEIDTWDFHIIKDIMMINIQDIGIPREERKPIIILINSNGGLFELTNSIIDAIRTSVTPVWTVNMGLALSGGGLIFIAGERRFTTYNSYCMTHTGSGGTSGTYEQTVEQQKVYNEQVKNMGEYIMECTGLDAKTWKKYKNKDWWLNCEAQIEYGFATDILESLDQILGAE